ncbi:MAG TPA: hypothetical protein VHQ01_10520 [Pyrinomonadaceae bacterium]|nr:hypothetical protein [Pyrinomonadaceae bacterium]
MALLAADENPTIPFVEPKMFILDDENRKNPRFTKYLKAIIEVRPDRLITWFEETPLIDFSAVGAGFKLTRPVKPGCIVLLTMRMPRDLRGYDFSETDYNVWGLVRRCVGGNGQQYSVGVAFIGKTPPADYNDDPKNIYDLLHSEPIDGFWQISRVTSEQENDIAQPIERKQTRFDIPEEITLELMNDEGWAIASETTVTLNLSSNGAAVYSQLNAEVGSLVRVSSSRSNIRLISVVRGKYAGHDGLSRINLEFIDQLFPMIELAR